MSRRNRASGLVWAALGLVLVGGCASDLTEIVVVVDSDLDAPAQLDEIVVSAEGPQGVPQVARASLVGGSTTRFPVTVGLRPSSDPNAAVAIRATGRHDGVDRVAAQVLTHFIEGRRLLVYIELGASCVDVSCGETETCRAGACIDATVDANALPPFTGVPGPDLGPVDLGVLDAPDSVDGGGLDAGTGDAGDGGPGPTDAGDGGTDAMPSICANDSDCNDGIDCTTDRCGTLGICMATPTDGRCPGGGRCDIASGGCVAATTCSGPADCDDGNPCTTDSCRLGGRCMNRSISCAGTPCHPGSCDPATGTCVTVDVADGTSCFPSVTALDCGGACSTGVCTGTYSCATGCVCASGSSGSSTCQTTLIPPTACPP